jgi:PhoPQ-activated pathogenicity-related protein
LWDGDWNPFHDEEDDLVLRAENSFLARSFDLALITEDYSWATLFPMVKAVVRSMDVLQEFLKQINGGKNIVNEFMLVGHSKRGWTTLLTAAVDDRVNAVAALSFDFVNMAEQYALLAASWGEPGFAMSKYEEFDLSQRFLTVEGLKFLEVIDPYYYSESLDVPKLVIVGTGDPYSIVDSVNLYLNDLPGSTHIHYNPNQGHDIHKLPGTLDVISAFFRKTAKNNPMPEFEYDCSSDGSFKITGITQTPVSVKLWTATNPSARDFRVGQDPPILWSSSSDAVIKDSYNTYSGAVTDLPEEGYTAFYIEMIFKDGIKNLDKSYSLATPVKVIGE